MKPLSFFVIGACLFLFSCNEEVRQATDTDVISIIIDRTERNPQFPTPESIHAKFSVGSGDHSAGGRFRLGQIVDIEYSPIATTSIEPQSLLLQNPGDRKRAVASFFASIDASLERLKGIPAGKDESEVFAIVAREANTLSKMSGSTLYVFSDLMENHPSGGISFYNRKTLDKLMNDSDAIAKQLEALQPLGDLHGLKLVLVYNAPDYESSVRYHAISKIYEKIFEAHNASVAITAAI